MNNLHAQCLFFQTFSFNFNCTTFNSKLRLETEDLLILKLPTINLVTPLLSVFGDTAWTICFQQLYSKFGVEKTVFKGGVVFLLAIASQAQSSASSMFKMLVGFVFCTAENHVWQVQDKPSLESGGEGPPERQISSPTIIHVMLILINSLISVKCHRKK